PLFEQADQRGIIDLERLSRWRRDIDGEIRRVGKKRIWARRHAFSLPQTGRFCSSARMAEVRSVQQHLFLLPPGQIREARGCSGAPEGKEAVAVDTRKPNEGLFQFLAAHTFHRVAPEAVYLSHDTHLLTPSTPFVLSERSIQCRDGTGRRPALRMPHG